jgi:hypothetical protein
MIPSIFCNENNQSTRAALFSNISVSDFITLLFIINIKDFYTLNHLNFLSYL